MDDAAPPSSQASWEFSLSQDMAGGIFSDEHSPYDPCTSYCLSQDAQQTVLDQAPKVPPKVEQTPLGGTKGAHPKTEQVSQQDSNEYRNTTSYHKVPIYSTGNVFHNFHQIPILDLLSWKDDEFGRDALSLVTSLAQLCCHGSPSGFFFQHCGGLEVNWNGYNQKACKIETSLILSPVLRSVMEHTHKGARIKLRGKKPNHGSACDGTHAMVELVYVLFHLVMFMFQSERPNADHIYFFTKGLLETVMRKKEDCYNLLYIFVYVVEGNQYVLASKAELAKIWTSKWNLLTYKTLEDWIHSQFIEMVTRRNIWHDMLLPVFGEILDRTRVLLTRAGLKSVMHVCLESVTYDSANGKTRSCCVPIQLTFYESILSAALLLCQRQPVTMGLLDSTIVYVASRAGEAKKRRREGYKKRASEQGWKKAETFVKAWLHEREHLPFVMAPRDFRKSPILPPILQDWHLLEDMSPCQRSRYNLVLAMDNDKHTLQGWAEETHKLITVEGVKRLSGRWQSKWLNADPLDHYFKCMAQREQELYQNGGYRPCFCLKRTFFQRLMQQDSPLPCQQNTFNYTLVQRWTRTCPTSSIFELRKLLFPINYRGVHWMLADVDFLGRYIVIWDSLNYSTKEYQKIIMRYLRCEYKRVHGEEMTEAELEKWQLPDVTPFYPLKQPNKDDCGIMTILHADLLLTNRGDLFDLVRKAITENYDEVVLRCRERLAAMVLENITIPKKLN